MMKLTIARRLVRERAEVLTLAGEKLRESGEDRAAHLAEFAASQMWDMFFAIS